MGVKKKKSKLDKKQELEDHMFGSKKRPIYHDEFSYDFKHLGIYLVMIFIVLTSLVYLISPYQKSYEELPQISDTEKVVIAQNIGMAYEIILPKTDNKISNSFAVSLIIFTLVGFVLGTFVYLYHSKQHHKRK